MTPIKCTGLKCPMQDGKVDPATCKAADTCKWATKPLTNADRIRAMTDEELARHFSFRWCPPDRHCTALDKITCYDCWLDWLKQEVKDNG